MLLATTVMSSKVKDLFDKDNISPAFVHAELERLNVQVVLGQNVLLSDCQSEGRVAVFVRGIIAWQKYFLPTLDENFYTR